MNSMDLCLALMRADSEEQVIGLLKEAGYWDKPELWRYIGDFDGNWQTIGNQQSDPIAALAEKFINAIDSMLINACLMAGVEPKGPSAPSSMREAVARFFENAPNPKADHVGRISAWLDEEIRRYARMVTLAATGNKGREGPPPCLSIADLGEGQTPDCFPGTFLSIQRRNKVDIPFVQGKFNMGGTGALWFCGSQKLQLIVSRRNPSLLAPDATSRDAEWGFTVTRREATGGRSPAMTYLAPLNVDQPRAGDVLSFAAGELAILPESSTSVRDAYSRTADHGTLIKLYEYDLSNRSNIVFTRKGLRQRIETCLPELALPIGVFECRDFGGKEAGSYFTPARGTGTRLDQDKNEELLEFDPVGGVLGLNGEVVTVKVYAFKRKPGQKKQDGFLADYASGGGVLYAVNGQTHKQTGKEFFTRKTVDLDYLKDDLLVTVDCSAVDEIARDDLFMTSRDRNRVTPLWNQLERMVERFLKQNDVLRELAMRRREEAVRGKTEDNKALADLLGKVFAAAPDLAKVLLGGARLPAPFPKPGSGSHGAARDFKGKRFPTYFHFDKHHAGEDHKRSAELGRDLRATFVTDAQDDYFWRAAEHGSLTVTFDGDGSGTTAKDSSLALSRGIARWAGTLPEDARVGDVLTYQFDVQDPHRSEPFRSRLIVEVVPNTERNGGTRRRRKKQHNNNVGELQGEGGLALPDVVPVHRDDWGTYEFDERSALAVKGKSDASSSSSYDFFYNIENESLLRAQKASPEEAELIRERFRCALVLVGLALIQETEAQRRALSGSESLSVEDTVALTTRAVAPVLLPMIEMVGALSVSPDDD